MGSGTGPRKGGSRMARGRIVVYHRVACPSKRDAQSQRAAAARAM